jgi:hypothetical protein
MFLSVINVKISNKDFNWEKKRRGRYEKSKMFFFYYQYYIWNYIINGDKIYFVSEINISCMFLSVINVKISNKDFNWEKKRRKERKKSWAL